MKIKLQRKAKIIKKNEKKTEPLKSNLEEN